MTISVNYNASVLTLQRNLSYATSALSKALTRMSTGFKVNSAADDAAGLYVATKMNTQIRGLKQAQNNTKMGMNLLNTAEGALTNMSDLLNRIRDLSVQASNGVYGTKEREAMQKEIDALTAQFNQIKSGTNFNGKHLFELPAPSASPISTASTLNGLSNFASRASSFKLNSPVYAENAAAPLADAASGSVDFTSGQTQTVTIDGVAYTIKNLQSMNNSLTWVKDADGKVNFNASYFEIRGQKEVSHNLHIVGRNNTIYGGDKNDKITIGAEESNILNNIYAGGGNDEINVLTTNDYVGGSIYLQSGNNICNVYGGTTSVYGGTGSETISLFKTNPSSATPVIQGGAGDNIFNIYGNNWTVTGQNGNDTFNIKAGVTSGTFLGGGGSNTLNNLGGTEITAADITMSTGNAFNSCKSIALSGNQTISDITLSDGKRYSIQNTQGSSKYLLYNVDSSGRTIFTGANYVTIKALDSQSYKVGLNSRYLNFYGSDKNDDIDIMSINTTIYNGGGDDLVNVIGTANTVYLQSGNNTVNVLSNENFIFGGSGNDTFNINKNNHGIVSGGGGNNIFNVNAGYTHVVGGTGDDVFNIKAGISGVSIMGGTGTNTVTGNIAGISYHSGIQGLSNASTGIILGANETKNVLINGINYEITNRLGQTNGINAHYNSIDGKIYFEGGQVIIKGQTNKAHNVVLEKVKETIFYGGDLDDIIESRSGFNKIYGYGGNNKITATFWNYVYVGDGDNDITFTDMNAPRLYLGNGNNKITLRGTTAGSPEFIAGLGNNTWIINSNNVNINESGGNNIFYVNGKGCNIVGGNGNDTFIVKGDNNICNGGGGNDYFQVDSGADNTTIGGTGTNYIVDKGTGTKLPAGDVVKDPNSGVLTFTDNTTPQQIVIDGKTYTIKNTSTETPDVPSNTLLYNYNTLTGEIVFNGNGFTITSNDEKEHKIVVQGNNNVVSGANKNDTITVASGSGNVIHGLDGDDTITMDSSNNKISGDKGNDNLIINVSNGNYIIDGGEGNDNIKVNSSSNTNIKGSDGDDRITMTGNNNIVDGGNGNDYILATGNSNTINSSSGNDSLNIKGNNNTINETGNTDNHIGVDGTGNNIKLSNGNNNVEIIGSAGSAGNTVTAGGGNNNFDLKGDSAKVTTGNGNNSFDISGNKSVIQTGAGKDNFTVTGNQNTIKSGGGDDFFNIRQNADSNNLDGEGGVNKMWNYGTNTVFSNITDVTPPPIEFRFQIGANYDENSFINLSTGFLLDELGVNVDTEENARLGIELVDRMLEQINGKISEIGALSNRFESIIQSQTSNLENLAASVSTIMDADIAEESANFVKNQILQQTCAALLSSSQGYSRNIILSLVQ